MTPAMIFIPRNWGFCTDVADGEETYAIKPEQETNGEEDYYFTPWDEYEEEASCFDEGIKKAKQKSNEHKKGEGPTAEKENEKYLKSMERKIPLRPLTKKEFEQKQKFYESRIFRQRDAREKATEINIVPATLKGIR
jgi:hypothetical protein